MVDRLQSEAWLTLIPAMSVMILTIVRGRHKFACAGIVIRRDPIRCLAG